MLNNTRGSVLRVLVGVALAERFLLPVQATHAAVVEGFPLRLLGARFGVALQRRPVQVCTAGTAAATGMAGGLPRVFQLLVGHYLQASMPCVPVSRTVC
jgi:hypothetical protein